jgi:hypothetical protein
MRRFERFTNSRAGTLALLAFAVAGFIFGIWTATH